MKSANIKELRYELLSKEKSQVIDLCLRLSRFKKDNKELLTYLLFESANEESFIDSLKVELDDLFYQLRLDSIYYTNKGLRKILRLMDKNIRYSGIKETEVEIRLYFIQKMVEKNIPISSFKIYHNIWNIQRSKIDRALKTLHEDLQFDYQEQLEELIDEIG